MLYQSRDDKDEDKNSINIKILDSILDDDDETFFQIISQISNSDLNFNQRFKITCYKMPKILTYEPTYASLCSFFGAEKCINSLITLFPDGIKSDFFNKKDLEGRQPIHFACIGGQINILRLFYQEEFDLNAADNNGKKPSHYAAMSSNIDAIKYLWMKGIDILKQDDRKGQTPFHYACKYGNIEVVKFLCEKVAIQSELKFETKQVHYSYNSRISTPLHLACENGCVEVVKYILKNKKMARDQMKLTNNFSQRPIDCAIEKNNLECVQLLVSVSKANIVGHSRRHIPIVDASSHGFYDIVSFLLKQKNIRIDAIDSNNKNALIVAIQNNHFDVVQLLIENGIGEKLEKHLINDAFIASFYLSNLEITKYLDSKLNIPYEEMNTRFMNVAISLQNENLINFLLDKKCSFKDISSIDFFHNTWTTYMTFLKDKGFDFSHCKVDYQTPLIVKSIRHGKLETIKNFIDKGIELNSDIISEYNCIHCACKKGQIELFNFLMSYKPQIKNK